MPPNKLGPRELAMQFDKSLPDQYVGMDTVGYGNYAMGYTSLNCDKYDINDNKSFIVSVVGKGITFDAGGISIKPANNMHHMKFDMLGAATTLALSKCIEPLDNVVYHFMGCCSENLPNNYNFRPGDVIEYPEGTKVEIVNTDAEGRLVLADGIIEAKKAHKSNLIITIATLTGAARAALGNGTAVFGNNNTYIQKYLNYANECGQNAWHMPIWDSHRENIKHRYKKVAHLKNCGDIAGASTAAAFLEHFVGGTNWLHLDIAGSAYKDEMPTGVALEPLLKLLTSGLIDDGVY